MDIKKFKIILIIIVLFLLFSEVGFALAAERELEVQYPKVFGKTVGSSFEAYIVYIYYFLIFIGGLAFFGVLIYGGVEWLTSGGDPTKISDAKHRISQGFLGLIILLSSYLILYTINPDFLGISLPEIQKEKIKSSSTLKEKITDVYLCKEECKEDDIECIEEKCRKISSGKIPEDLKEFKKYILIKRSSDESPHYLILLYETEENYKLKKPNGVVIDEKKFSTGWHISNTNHVGVELEEAEYIEIETVSSYTSKKGGIRFCERKACEGEGKVWPNNGGFYHHSSADAIISDSNLSINFKIRAMEMEKEYYAILFSEKDFKGNSLLRTESDPHLGGNFAAEQSADGSWYARVKSMILIPRD